jgi:hypothetical protein
MVKFCFNGGVALRKLVFNRFILWISNTFAVFIVHCFVSLRCLPVPLYLYNVENIFGQGDTYQLKEDVGNAPNLEITHLPEGGQPSWKFLIKIKTMIFYQRRFTTGIRYPFDILVSRCSVYFCVQNSAG